MGLDVVLGDTLTLSERTPASPATPRGATGRVFGFVYAGLDVGSVFAPVTVGYLLDSGAPATVLWLVAGIFACAILTAVAIRPGAVPVTP